MYRPFLFLYDYFRRHRAVFFLTLVAAMLILMWRAGTVKLEEDITNFFPNDPRVENLNNVFRNSRFAERLVIMISQKDSADNADADRLVVAADSVVDQIEKNLASHITELRSKVDDQKVMELFSSVHEHLPVFLEDHDYVELDSILSPALAKERLMQNYRQLISPAGIVTKNIIVKDPLGISFLVLRKLQGLQYDENFELYDNYIVSKDHRHLLLFIQPAHSPNDTKGNAPLLSGLAGIKDSVRLKFPSVQMSYFGAPVVAAGNAKQLQLDTIITVSLMVVLLMVVLLGFFRKKRIPLLILLPVVFGALFSLACISFLQSSLSILALAVGAVILGIAVDYSLHFLVMVKVARDPREVIQDLAKPLTFGSATTVVAFLCLQFTNASVLRDIGLFAALSLVGAALASLIILPQLISPTTFSPTTPRWMNRVTGFSFETKRPFVYAILVATPVFLFLAGNVKFNEDMSKLNFMTDEVRESEKRLETINKAALNTVYVVSSSSSLEKAMQKNERAVKVLDSLKERGVIQKIASTSRFMISDSLQRERINRWNLFWTAERKDNLRAVVKEEGSKLKFSPLMLRNADSLLMRKYKPVTANVSNLFREAFFSDFILASEKTNTIITLANVPATQKKYVYNAFSTESSDILDRQMITNLFVEYVNADFNFIVTVTSVLVFVALLLVYGRIELTLITFLPMLFSWIWILGIMALFKIEFNIVNVMVSTFIFGLGDDYSIFITDGLQQEYKYGKKVLSSVRTSIFLSAFTTISGLGVLIFAQHPALRSIAAISIIGICCVFVMSQTLQPFLFRLLILDRVKKGYPPVTLRGILITVYTYGFFVTGSLLLTMVGLILKTIPFQRNRIRLFYHSLIKIFTQGLVYGAYNLKKRIVNKTPNTFSRASVIISNHSSFMDILLTTMLHPKLILLTNKWVWNSPVFGGVVRLADYYPVMEGAEDSVHRLRDRVKEGYSIVVFPEGTRSLDGKIKRFHKGAFYIAESMKLPIQPLLIHGADTAIRKGSMYVSDSTITLKFLPPIEPDDNTFGNTYSERAKNISRYFKEEHERLAREQETPHYFHERLMTNYLYKGPVLEWYMRIKVRLEKDYVAFNDLIPRKANILDLGCGYGFLSYMLQFVSRERVITGVDYDEEKIAIAQNGYLKTDRLNFIYADVTRFPLSLYDVIVISDVLHYLSQKEQEDLVTRCFEALNPGGKVIIRDGNKDLEERHRGTKLTEFFSVKLLKFNKSKNELNFISGAALTEMATNHGLKVSIQDETRFTSNVIFVISKPDEVHAAV